jgi:hypothetical protein
MYKQIIKFSDDLFLLNKRVLDNPKYVDKILDEMMLFFNSNKVLRKDGFLFFLEKIEEADVIEWLPKEE